MAGTIMYLNPRTWSPFVVITRGVDIQLLDKTSRSYHHIINYSFHPTAYFYMGNKCHYESQKVIVHAHAGDINLFEIDLALLFSLNLSNDLPHFILEYKTKILKHLQSMKESL